MPNSQSLPLLTWRPIAQFLGVIALGGAKMHDLIFLMINFCCLLKHLLLKILMISYLSHNSHTPGAPKHHSFWHHISNHQRIRNRNRSLLPRPHKDRQLNSRTYLDRKRSPSYNLNFLLKGINRQSWHYNNEWQIYDCRLNLCN